MQPRTLPREVISRRRKVLPITLETGGKRISIKACPDTGSEVNIISLETARRLGFSPDIRIVEETVPHMHSLQVNFVGRSRKSLICRLDTYVSLATADTGSDIDLISGDYARRRGFPIDEAFHDIMLADGTVEQTCGLIRSSFTVGLVDDVRGFMPKSQTISLDCFVLTNLSSDVLIGQDTIEELNIFANHSESFIPSIPLTGESDVNIICYIGKAERAGKRLWATIQGIDRSRDPSSGNVRFLAQRFSY